MQSSLNEIIARADALYAERSEIKNIALSVELLKDAAANSYEAAWRLGRALFFLGQETQSQVEAHAHHAQGASACRRAVKLRPERVEGQLWLGVNLALMAQTEKQFRAFRHVLSAKRALRRAARIDPGYHAAGPFRVLGRVQHKLPRVFGGGHKNARANFEQALQLAPDNTVTRTYFAELQLEIGEEHSAREHLEAILRSKPDPAWDFETKRDQKFAREKLAMIGKNDK